MPMMDTAYLDAMLEDIKPKYIQLTGKDVVESINSFAEHNNLDLVMVIPKNTALSIACFIKAKAKS